MSEIVLLPILLCFAALLYASVGHGGASGYLAVMALFSIAPATMKPTALVMNVVVSSIAWAQFYRARHFSWRIFLPFAVTSIPFAYWGGSLNLSATLYKSVVGVVLLFSAVRIFAMSLQRHNETNIQPLPVIWALLLGALLGFISGLTGVGGGIFLSPLLLMLHVAETKQVSGISAAFIGVNSLAGLFGNGITMALLPPHFAWWIVAVLLGGSLGATLGAFRFDTTWLRRFLALVLLMAGAKMLFGG